MMKKLALLFLLIPGSAFAQQITITGQVKDPNGVPYTNGRGRVLLTPTNVFFTTGLTNPVPGSQSPVIIDGLDANGRFSVALTSTAALDQQSSNPQWMFTFCSAPILQFGPICFSGPILALTSSQDITTQISAVPPPILPGGGTGGAPPAPPAGSLQKSAAPPVTFSASSVSEPPSGIFAGGLSVAEDMANKGPNPWVDIRHLGARPLTIPAQTTTANCNGTTTVTLTGAIDFINGDGIVLHQCGPVSTLTTPAAPASVTPKGILNGATTRCYEVIAEDNLLGVTAASSSTCTTAGASSFGTNAVNLSTCTQNNGTLSCTTTANHNFEVGAPVKISNLTIPGNTAFNYSGIYTVQTTPSATTFTVKNQFANRPDFNATMAGVGTAEAPAHVWVKWTSQVNVLRWWIYRQDAGAGPFNLVGVAQGMEPFFDDYNYAPPLRSPEVPATAPSVAANQALVTTIVSGAGTTSITVANAASNTVSGISALHDNTVAYLAAISAVSNTNGGGVVYTPNGGNGTAFVMNFPLKFPPASNGTNIRHFVSGEIILGQPMLPSSFTEIDGYSPQGTGNPAFASTWYAQIAGSAYPLILIQGKGDITLDHLQLRNSGGGLSQQWLFVTDVGQDGVAGSAFVAIHRSDITTFDATGAAVVVRGNGFGFHIDDTIMGLSGANASNYFNSGALRIIGSNVISPNGWMGQGLLRDVSFLGAGVVVDGDSAPAASVGPNNWVFSNVFSESNCAPIFLARNINTSNWSNWTIDDLVTADTVGGCGTLIHMDMSSPTVSGLRGLSFSPLNNGGGNLSIITSNSILASNIFNGNQNDFYNFGSTYAAENVSTYNNLSNGGPSFPQKSFETNGVYRTIPPGAVFVQGNVPTNVAASVQAGGSLALCSVCPITVTAVDWNGGESQQSAPAFVTTTSGNQTVQVSWTAPSPAPQGYFVYFNASRMLSTITTGTSLTFGGVPAAGSPPFASAGGPSGMSSIGIWTNQSRYTSGQFKSDITAPALTANRTVAWPDQSGTVNLGAVYSTVSATTGASIGTTTMVTAGTGGNKYVFNATAAQVAGGTSCTGNSTLAIFVNYTDAVTNAAQVPILGGYSIANSTFAGNAAPVLAVTNGTANTMAINWNPMVINAKPSTTVSYGTTYTVGTGCSPAPTYYVVPSLVQIQ